MQQHSDFFVGVTSQDSREEVIQAWYMDDSDEDQRLPHHKDPKEFVSLDQLAGDHHQRAFNLRGHQVVQCIQLTCSEQLRYITEFGVLSWRLDADNYETDEELKKLREERGYSYMVCFANSLFILVCFTVSCIVILFISW